MPHTRIVCSSQAGKGSNAATSFTQIWFCHPTQLIRKPVSFCKKDYTDTSLSEFLGVPEETCNTYQALKTEFLKHSQHNLKTWIYILILCLYPDSSISYTQKYISYIKLQ